MKRDACPGPRVGRVTRGGEEAFRLNTVHVDVDGHEPL